MEQEPYLKCACESCGAHIEFPTVGVGQTIPCPHCQENTKLQVAKDDSEPSGEPSPRKTRWGLIAAGCVALLAAAGAGLFFARNQAANNLPETTSAAKVSTTDAATNATETSPNARRAPKRPQLEKNGLQAFHTKLEKSNKSRLVYATGVVRNKSGKSRFGVKVELDLIDAKGNKLGTASDYVQVIEPGKEWKYRALVTEPDAVKVKIVGITEE